MLRQVWTTTLVALTAVGCVARAAAQQPKAADGKKQITNSVGMKLVLIPAGEFMMGSGEPAEATAKFFTERYAESQLTAETFKDEHPQHRVRITRPFYKGIYHVTRGQFRQFVGETGYLTDAEKGENPGAAGWNPKKKTFERRETHSWREVGFEQTDEHPVINVSWNDAVAFCRWLSGKEGKTYRLPTEAEWEYACRAGTTTRYHSGDDPETLAKVANVCDATAKAEIPDHSRFAIKASDGYAFTAPVGSFPPNAFGLHDMHGNAYQWCADWYGANYYAKSPVDDPVGPASGTGRLRRGGSWTGRTSGSRSAYRQEDAPDIGFLSTGFRVVGTQEAAPLAPRLANAKPPITNSIGMKLVRIPAGEFLMGSGESAKAVLAFFGRFHGGTLKSTDGLTDQLPQHRVRITRPFYLGIHHVTRGQFRRFVDETGYKTDAEKGEKPGAYGWNWEQTGFEFKEKYSWQSVGFEQTDEHPVVNVSWNDAVAFCKWLGHKEGKAYRLPTEAEWEYACRAGTITQYHSGDDPETLAKVANVGDATVTSSAPQWRVTIKASDGYLFTAPVGSFAPNAFGLHDMHGNAWQWCADWYGAQYYATSPTEGPLGPALGIYRVLRGGSWLDAPRTCRSAHRRWDQPDARYSVMGFRVVGTEESIPSAAPGPQVARPAAPPREAGLARVQPPIANSVGIKLVRIPAGEFLMGIAEPMEATAAFFRKYYGQDAVTADYFQDQLPQHPVRITRPFYLGIHHVTRGQFRRFVEDAEYKTDAEKGGNPGGYGWSWQKSAYELNEKYSWRNAGFEQTDEHPVVNVSWNDAVAFCKWLGRREGKTYRLPTEAEWEYACRAGTTTHYHSGDDPETLAKVANVGDATVTTSVPGWRLAIKASDGYLYTAPVGSFAANAFGLYDMHGNAWQWCGDWYGAKYYATSPAADPPGPESGVYRVVRGSTWLTFPHMCGSAHRLYTPPDGRYNVMGFRIVGTEEPRPPEATPPEPRQPGGLRPITNSIEMKLALIPAGGFVMGSGESAEATAASFNKLSGEVVMAAANVRHEHPQHWVQITRPFYLGVHHVTRGQFRRFVEDAQYKTDAEKGEKPGAYEWNWQKNGFEVNEKYSWRNAGFEQTDEHPVLNVSWNDAVAFCQWLSGKEGKTYRLPTEAEWEYACRAGTTTRYYNGDDPETLIRVANVADATLKAKNPSWAKITIKASDGYAFTAPVGSFAPNAFGVHDMHGNAWQWCADWYGEEFYATSPADDPAGPESGAGRVLRGSAWLSPSYSCRSAYRSRALPDSRYNVMGFRVVRSL